MTLLADQRRIWRYLLVCRVRVDVQKQAVRGFRGLRYHVTQLKYRLNKDSKNSGPVTPHQ